MDCFLLNHVCKKLIGQTISQKQISSGYSREKNQPELFFRKFTAKLICNQQKAGNQVCSEINQIKFESESNKSIVVNAFCWP